MYAYTFLNDLQAIAIWSYFGTIGNTSILILYQNIFYVLSVNPLLFTIFSVLTSYNHMGIILFLLNAPKILTCISLKHTNDNKYINIQKYDSPSIHIHV